MATKKSAGPATKGLKVTAKTASFWRGGIEFGHEAKTLPLSDLTVDQAEAIQAEGERRAGMLVVEEVSIEPSKT